MKSDCSDYDSLPSGKRNGSVTHLGRQPDARSNYKTSLLGLGDDQKSDASSVRMQNGQPAVRGNLPYIQQAGLRPEWNTSYPSPWDSYIRSPSYGPFMGGMGNFQYQPYGSGIYPSWRPYSGAGSTVTNEQDRYMMEVLQSSQGAFSSLASIVDVFTSLSNMVSMSYNAIYSSFQAFVNLAAIFSQIKYHLFILVSSRKPWLAIRRWLHKLAYIIGIVKANPSLHGAWNQATSGRILTEQDVKGGPTALPVLIFLSFIFAGPYILWKILRMIVGDQPAGRNWELGEGLHYEAIAQEDFRARTPSELSIQKGDKVILAPGCLQSPAPGFLRAALGPGRSGLIPSSHLQILGIVQGPSISAMGPVPPLPPQR
ncbi:unnamed protein product [Darwinula stevensoni]|uniref:Peroxisomal membrane protein PEX13 n=1 Tax=Darwinula stevensoni TaxID=69355 RepID=A0A7R9A038_9CRUS|nr:unnamed protein product [Darwinula stevensoni]CAG0880198.1 unnamed protein product [Darwinula stevensoni]